MLAALWLCGFIPTKAKVQIKLVIFLHHFVSWLLRLQSSSKCKMTDFLADRNVASKARLKQ
jgi:hypothetical protein